MNTLLHRNRFPARLLILGSLLACCRCSAPAYCQQNGSANQGSKEAQNPTSPANWEIGAGYLLNMAGSPANAGYYRLTYKGQLLTKSGTPPTLANVGKPLELPSLTSASGDSSNTLFALDRGNAQMRGFLATYFKTQEAHLGNVPFRLTATLTARGDGKQYNAALGAELPPVHPFHWLNKAAGLGLTNYAIFGFSGQHEFRAEELGKDQDVGLLTYRAFIGRGFQWVKSRGLQNAVDALSKATTKRVVDPAQGGDFYAQVKKEYDDTLAAQSKLKALPSVADTYFFELVQQIDAGAISKPQSRQQWNDLVTEYTTDFHRSHADRPSYAVWIDSAGFYSLTGRIDGTTSPARFNNLLGATLKVWLDPKSENETWLQIRYENGRDRAAPTVYKNTLYFIVGLTFK